MNALPGQICLFEEPKSSTRSFKKGCIGYGLTGAEYQTVIKYLVYMKHKEEIDRLYASGNLSKDAVSRMIGICGQSWKFLDGGKGAVDFSKKGIKLIHFETKEELFHPWENVVEIMVHCFLGGR